MQLEEGNDEKLTKWRGRTGNEDVKMENKMKLRWWKGKLERKRRGEKRREGRYVKRRKLNNGRNRRDVRNSVSSAFF